MEREERSRQGDILEIFFSGIGHPEEMVDARRNEAVIELGA